MLNNNPLHLRYTSLRTVAIDSNVATIFRTQTLAAHLTVLLITGNAVFAADAIGQLILQTTPSLHEIDPSIAVETLYQICGIGISFAIISIVLGDIVCRTLGPRWCSITGIFLYFIGFCLLLKEVLPTLFSLKYLASICLGLSYGLSLNSHLEIIYLFPGNAPHILLMLGVTSSLAIAGPWILHIGTLSSSSIFGVTYVITTSIVALVLDSIFLPTRSLHPFEPYSLITSSETLSNTVHRRQYKWVASGLLTTGTDAASGMTTPRSDKQKYHDSGSLRKQVFYSGQKGQFGRQHHNDPDRYYRITLVVAFFILSFLRWKTFILSYRQAYQEAVQRPSRYFHVYADCCTNLLTCASFVLPMWTYILNRYGAPIFMALSNITGTLPFLLLSISYEPFLGTISALFALHFASVPGQLTGLLTHITGLQEDAHSILCLSLIITGIISLLHDLLWPKFVLYCLPSFRIASGIMVAISGFGFLFAILLAFCQQLSLVTELEDELNLLQRMLTSITDASFVKNLSDGTKIASRTMYSSNATAWDPVTVARYDKVQSFLAEHQSLASYMSGIPLVPVGYNKKLLHVLWKHERGRLHWLSLPIIVHDKFNYHKEQASTFQKKELSSYQKSQSRSLFGSPDSYRPSFTGNTLKYISSSSSSNYNKKRKNSIIGINSKREKKFVHHDPYSDSNNMSLTTD